MSPSHRATLPRLLSAVLFIVSLLLAYMFILWKIGGAPQNSFFLTLGRFFFDSFREGVFYIPLYIAFSALFLMRKTVSLRLLFLWSTSLFPFLTIVAILHLFSPVSQNSISFVQKFLILFPSQTALIICSSLLVIELAIILFITFQIEARKQVRSQEKIMNLSHQSTQPTTEEVTPEELDESQLHDPPLPMLENPTDERESDLSVTHKTVEEEISSEYQLYVDKEDDFSLQEAEEDKQFRDDLRRLSEVAVGDSEVAVNGTADEEITLEENTRGAFTDTEPRIQEGQNIQEDHSALPLIKELTPELSDKKKEEDAKNHFFHTNSERARDTEAEVDTQHHLSEEIDSDTAESIYKDQTQPGSKEQSFSSIQQNSSYHIPTEGVLHTHEFLSKDEDGVHIQRNVRLLESTLDEFGIQAEVTGIRSGSTLTLFEVLPAPGIKLTKISNLADNIALRLAAESVRIVAPIPGKEAVGIEVPNKNRRIVLFGNIVKAKEFWNKLYKIPIVLGEEIAGTPRICDLRQMPHLLIAGATGSGKSVCVNSFICSLLYHNPPERVKLILIDPKIVELNFYNDVPHLLTPVVTKPSRAFQVLQYCICEMERRYSELELKEVRDIDSYNRKIQKEGLDEPEMPYIVLVIDEFADLMMSSGKDIEATVSRLTAMSRAVGIHVVLATQRPSTDVITGLIKANIPSRIAFMVASKIDSRIIIDISGAEKLLGRGDMLFSSVTDSFPIRIQGAFLSEEEVQRIVVEVKKHGPPDYHDDEIFIDDESFGYDEPQEDDPLYKNAVEIVTKMRKASASYLQRKLKVGYNRAARLIEEMERRKIVGPANGSKARELLVSSLEE